ncbi:MAG: hypothetical protein HYT36_03455 [Candidatus Staskawiczbacteria bacterium]|nr:hypothetical protein [Candidatus Staskawiczbacteria bacterium]
MKKFLIIALFLALTWLFLPEKAFALATTLTDLGKNIVTAFWIVFMVFAVVFFLLAGIMFLTAQGDPEKISRARSAMIWGVAGVVVGIVSGSIFWIILGFL